MAYTVVIAGTTHNTLQCAQALQDDARFDVTAIITPAPKPIGRKKILTPNPLHVWADDHAITSVLIEKKIDETVKASILSLEKPDYLLVVDFGYIIKPWLLDWPAVAPVNIHPSDLPCYRGSSPGQFALLFGETTSAVTIMKMDELMDHGPVIKKFPFAIDPMWLAADYYKHAFSLVTKELANTLDTFAQDPGNVSNQPDDTPTPIARMLTRDDGFIPFETLQGILRGETAALPPIPLLSSYTLSPTPSTLFSMYRAFHPWPGLWTTVNVQGEDKRMKLLSCTYDNDILKLEMIQIEGKTPQKFSDTLLH